jgi:hypothetical protein
MLQGAWVLAKGFDDPSVSRDRWRGRVDANRVAKSRNAPDFWDDARFGWTRIFGNLLLVFCIMETWA